MAEPAPSNGTTLAQGAKTAKATDPSQKSTLASTFANGSTDEPLTHYHSVFSSLLAWDNPRDSAIAYSSIITFIFAVRYLDVIRYMFKATWMALAFTVLAEVAGKVITGNGFVSAFRPRKYITISQDTLAAVIGDVHELLNFFAIEAQRLFFVENVAASICAFFAALTSYYLVKFIPYWGLAILSVTTTFFLPLIYSSNQEFIDQQIEDITEIINTQVKQGKELAGQHTAQVAQMGKQYIGDYSAKAQAMIGGAKGGDPKMKNPTKEYNDTDFPKVPEKDAKDPVSESEDPKKEDPLVAL